MKDFSEDVAADSTIVPQVATDVVTGTGVDLAGFNSATFLVAVDQLASGVTATVAVEDSPDNDTFTAVDSTLLKGSVPSLTSSQAASVYKVGYLGDQRYLRVSVTALAGTGKSISVSAVVLKGSPRSLPK